jgi:DMSO/TMAO reductase YedYZ molybdopterin-dependent catalytic subunit
MTDLRRIAQQHVDVTRRYFLQLGAAGVVGMTAAPLWAKRPAELDAAISRLEYLTRAEDFRIFGRGDPHPYALSPEQRLAVGLDRKTWRLEVVADPESDAQIDNPLTKELGTAIDWQALMKLAEQHAVRFLKVMTCTNVGKPLGMGLWEGIPLRDVIWLARPKANVRRVFYYGYHNDDPKQLFQSSLPLGRVLEDPPGELPVILCYKLNNEWLSPRTGAPLRVVVPDAYGNKSVKWLQRIVLTNRHQANDTYALWNNDTVSHLKTGARFVSVPEKVSSGQPVPVTGLAQTGMSGLKKVQICAFPHAAAWPKDDPYFTRADWQDAEILPPPDDWGGGLPGGKLPADVRQIDPATGRPRHWPLRDTLVHWATLLDPLPRGRYDLRCRTIDANDVAQPMPRPYKKSGHNAIERVTLVVA